jgi:hypothetical protein
MTEIETKYDGERYFSWWLDELKDAGYIDDWKFQFPTFELFNGAEYTATKKTKVSTKIKCYTKEEKKKYKLLESCTYTPDFLICWNDKANKIFYEMLGSFDLTRKDPVFFADLEKYNAQYNAQKNKQNIVSFVDVKPIFTKRDSDKAKFAVLQKWVCSLYKYYIQPVIIQKLFNKTFTPKRYLPIVANWRKKECKSHWQVRSLEEFIKLNHKKEGELCPHEQQ